MLGPLPENGWKDRAEQTAWLPACEILIDPDKAGSAFGVRSSVGVEGRLVSKTSALLANIIKHRHHTHTHNRPSKLCRAVPLLLQACTTGDVPSRYDWEEGWAQAEFFFFVASNGPANVPFSRVACLKSHSNDVNHRRRSHQTANDIFRRQPHTHTAH